MFANELLEANQRVGCYPLSPSGHRVDYLKFGVLNLSGLAAWRQWKGRRDSSVRVANCSHKWSFVHEGLLLAQVELHVSLPTSCAAQFQTGHNLVMDRGLGTPDLRDYLSPIVSACPVHWAEVPSVTELRKHDFSVVLPTFWNRDSSSTYSSRVPNSPSDLALFSDLVLSVFMKPLSCFVCFSPGCPFCFMFF